MEFFGKIGGINDIAETTNESKVSFDSETLKKYNKLMGNVEKMEVPVDETPPLTPKEVNDKYNSLMEQGGFFDSSITQDAVDSATKTEKTEFISDEVIAKDDNGNYYMKNGDLLPNNEYTINENNTYKTDEQGRIVSFETKPTYTDEGGRNLKEQREIGGEDRKENDDGGHLVAKVLGGSEGRENLVPMRSTINRSDYKKMEKEIADACKDNKEVSLQGELEYDGDSQRPSMISTEYQIDDKRTVSCFDNNENSTELLDTLKDKITEDDYNNLCNEIQDMQDDDNDVSITSVKTEYDTNNDETKVTVTIRNETESERMVKVYYPNKED